MTMRLLFALVATVIFGNVARAQTGDAPADGDRPIVYAARYYTASKAKSHLHLYRINADGSGKKQITTGEQDEFAPRWLGDGRQLFFERDTGKSGADGEMVTQFRILDTATGKERDATAAEERAGATYPDVTPGVAVQADMKGVTLTRRAKKVTLAYGKGMVAARGEDYFSVSLPPQSHLEDPDGYLEPEMMQAYVPLPGDGRLLLRALSGDSTDGHYYVYLLADEAAKTARLFAVADELRFAPDGKRFIATCGRGLLPLGKGDKRSVYVRTLYIGTVKNGVAANNMRPLVTGLVSIAGYDWKPAQGTGAAPTTK